MAQSFRNETLSFKGNQEGQQDTWCATDNPLLSSKRSHQDCFSFLENSCGDKMTRSSTNKEAEQLLIILEQQKIKLQKILIETISKNAVDSNQGPPIHQETGFFVLEGLRVPHDQQPDKTGSIYYNHAVGNQQAPPSQFCSDIMENPAMASVLYESELGEQEHPYSFNGQTDLQRAFQRSIDHLRTVPVISLSDDPQQEETHAHSASSVTGRSTDASSASSADPSTPVTFTFQQAGRWQERYNDLIHFRNNYSHCCVPSHWPQNAPLSQWVKRQRCQWRLKREGKRSNMTQERELALDRLGFVWDSHSIFWEERLKELKDFVWQHGHPNVPSRFPENQQLSIWCKCQRRQFKLFAQRDPRSNITMERINKLRELGFDFNPRKKKL